jgi:hypothetical protein
MLSNPPAKRENAQVSTCTPQAKPLIETVFDELQNLCQVARTRHRSHTNFSVDPTVASSRID